ncbi:MAG: uridine-cytidine kinase [Cyclobacteriaceae bacterium]|nr:uridine-cytidine kinase [Cyclobacteriaceae bacterium]MCH8516788.1 uridine-cytidine kinase [Cyclobacteriaceae bacterium]
MNTTPFFVGITGGSASGKTVFLDSLLETFSPDELCLISQDNYYKSRDLQPLDEEGVHNFDTPDSIDKDLYLKDLLQLKSGKSVEKLEYTFNNPNKKPRKLIFNPAPVVVVEGLFVLYYPEVANLLDLTVFIDAKEHIKLKRRIIRDKIDRGYDLDDVLYRYDKHVMPTYEKYIEPFKYDADLIVPNNSTFSKGLEVITAYLKSKVEG